MKIKKSFLILSILLIFILFIGSVSANELENNETVVTVDDAPMELEQTDEGNLEINEENNNACDEIVGSSNEEESVLGIPSEEIVVEDWNELKYYCSLTDKDYVLKLKENTNYYPENPLDKSYQITVNNKVTILGAYGAYIGDSSSNPAQIRFTAFVVPDDAKASLTIDNVTFKYIRLLDQPDGILIKMAGKKNNVIKNCVFENINMEWGHSCIVYLKKGTATLQNCSFVNCTTCFGCVSVYDPNSYTSAHMTMKDCYFENNYASTEPGCINNCGILEVYNTIFYKNSAYWWAGAIHTHICANTTIYNSYFIDNVAGWNGGALYTYSWLQIYNSTFIGNNCTTNNGGGAIGACTSGSSPHIYIENSIFIDNQNNEWSSGRGGAISIMDDGSIEVLNSTFIENSAKTGSAICAISQAGYGSPSIIISGNKFINHTRINDVLNVRVSGTPAVISDNYYLNNSIVFSTLSLEALDVGKDSATLKITNRLANPSYYDEDILNKTLYDVFVNGEYVKTVDSTVFVLEFGDLDICDVYVVPTIGNSRTNIVTLISTREYIFASKEKGNDTNNGLSRDSPVYSLSKAIELAQYCKNILIMDGTYSEDNLNVNYDLAIKGEGNTTITTQSTGNIFEVNADSFVLKNLIIDGITAQNFIKQNTNGKIEITRTIFKNNNVQSLFDVQNSLNVSDSILINNTGIVSGIGGFDLDCNWWGNTNENYNNAPNSLVNNWLFLNISTSNNNLELNQKTTVNFDYNLINKENNIITGLFDLPGIDLTIFSLNGKTSKDIVNPSDKLTYTLNTTSDGSITATYNDIASTIGFNFIKSNPAVNVKVMDVFVGNDVAVEVSLPKDATGNITLTLGDITQKQEISNNKIVFTIPGLPAEKYTATITYSGDNHYNNYETEQEFNVNKYESITQIIIGEVRVHENVDITVIVPTDATGNITLKINNKKTYLNVSNPYYTIYNITRGDYVIEATYNGDAKYLSSSDGVAFDVDKLNTTFTATAKSITYGEDTIIEVKLNDNATGTVTATVDGKTNTSTVLNGKAEIVLSKVDAGENKTINLHYSGDNTYLKQDYALNYTVSKAKLDYLNISVEDIMIGKDANLVIVTPLNVGGTFTITCVDQEVVDVSPFGQTSYSIRNLNLGEHDVTVVYNGNNYETCSNSTSFAVKEYLSAQWQNEGYDVKNTGKTEYTSNITEGIIWTTNISTVKNMVIDCDGNIYVILENNSICSIDREGSIRWIYTRNDYGDFSGLAISRDVVIAPKSGDTLYFINQTTGLKYGSSNIYQASSEFAPIVDKNSNVFIVSEYQYDTNNYNLVIVPYNIWEYGGTPTIISLGNYRPLCSPTLVDDDLVVVLCENRLRVIDISTGRTIFTKSANYQSIRPVVDEGKNIYTVQGDYLVACSITGSQLWKTKITNGAGNKLYLDNDCLYMVNSESKLIRYNIFDGSESMVCDLTLTSDILIDQNSKLYFGSENTLYAMSKDGKTLWKTQLNNSIVNSIIMDREGILYLTTDAGELYAITQNPLKETGIDINTSDVTYGKTENIKIVLNSDVTGNVTVKITGGNYSSVFDKVLTNGVAFVELTSLKPGDYSVDVYYGGDENYKSADNYTVFNVFKAKSSINVYMIDGMDIISVLNDGNGNVIANAEVCYSINNNTAATSSDEEGRFAITIDGGNCLIEFKYDGDDCYLPSDCSITLKNIKPMPKATKIVVPSTMTKTAVDYNAGEKGSMFYFTLQDEDGKAVANKAVKIGIFDKIYTVKTDKNGRAGLQINIANANYYTYAISFLGDDDYKASFAVCSLQIVKKAVTITPAKTSYAFTASAKTKTVTATLKSTNSYIPKGKQVTLTVAGKTFKATIGDKGKINFNIGSVTKKGTYNVVIKFAGTNTYSAANSRNIKIVIK